MISASLLDCTSTKRGHLHSHQFNCFSLRSALFAAAEHKMHRTPSTGLLAPLFMRPQNAPNGLRQIDELRSPSSGESIAKTFILKSQTRAWLLVPSLNDCAARTHVNYKAQVALDESMFVVPNASPTRYWARASSKLMFTAEKRFTLSLPLHRWARAGIRLECCCLQDEI